MAWRLMVWNVVTMGAQIVDVTGCNLSSGGDLHTCPGHTCRLASKHYGESPWTLGTPPPPLPCFLPAVGTVQGQTGLCLSSQLVCPGEGSAPPGRMPG